MVAGVLRWLLDKFSVKFVLVLVLLAAALWGGWKIYDGILESGIAQGVAQQNEVTKKVQEKLDKVQLQLTAAEKTIKDNQAQYDEWKAATLAANAAIQAAQDKVNKDLSLQLAQTQQDLATVKKLKDDLSKYISKANDAACTLPNGFVFLYDQSLTASRPLLTLPAGTLAYAPAGISLSDATRVILDNNAASRDIRQKLIDWQTWWQNVQPILSKYPIPSPPASSK